MTDTVAAVVAFGSVYYVVPRIAGVGPTLHCCAGGERGDAQCSLGGGERILRARVESTPHAVTDAVTGWRHRSLHANQGL